MLKTKAALAALAAVFVSAVLLVAPQGPSASAACVERSDPVTGEVYIVCDEEGTDPASPDPETGFTPGPSLCIYRSPEYGNVQIPCQTNANDYWSNGRQCYVSVQDPQLPPPPGGAPTGAWYNCEQYSGPQSYCASGPRDCYGVTFWSNIPPPGIVTLTPAQAAWRLALSFQIRGVEIGFAPDPDIPGSQSYVGVPIWMWVENPQPLTYGPYSQTATLGGVTITATARVTSILWNMGDGQTVACGNPGTPFVVAYGAVDSPTCGYRYSRTSDNQPGGRYTVTATSQWSVTWTGGGTGGTIPLTTTSQSTVEIGELQSVVVNGTTNNERD